MTDERGTGCRVSRVVLGTGNLWTRQSIDSERTRARKSDEDDVQKVERILAEKASSSRR